MEGSVDFDYVINGIVKYLDREIYAGMNDWQTVIARVAVSRFIGNKDALRDKLVHSPYAKTFAIIDDEGMVDVDGLARDLKEQISQYDGIAITIPLLGTFRFNEEDVDKLHSIIMRCANE